MRSSWNRNAEAIALAMPFPQDEVVAMRARLEALRDTLIVLGLQIVFRAAMLLRRWNY
jgi:hypothetical protein